MLGVAKSTASSDWDMMRGVAFSVPQVINCFTAAGPSSAAVGEGRSGTREKFVGDLGRSEEETHYGKSELKVGTHTRSPGYSSFDSTSCGTWRRRMVLRS